MQNPFTKTDINEQICHLKKKKKNRFVRKEHDSSKHSENFEKEMSSTGLNEDGVSYMWVR